VSKLVQTPIAAALVLAALTYAGPTLIALVRALVPLVLVVGTVITVLWLVRYFTRRP
jgi:hypothetical protein